MVAARARGCCSLRVPSRASATEFATTTDSAHVAYQVAGEGQVDVAWLGPGSHLEVERDIPQVASYVDHLASFSRLIRFDLRGSGQSDPLPPGEPLSLDGIAADLLAVLDAAGSEDVAVLANGYGGLIAIFFAAKYLDRTAALVLDGCSARTAWAPEYPCGLPTELLDIALARVEERDTGVDIEYLAPSLATNAEFVAGYRRIALASANRAMAMAQARLVITADVRNLLHELRVPTLVLYRSDDLVGGEPHARYLAEHIPNAKLVEIPGVDNLSFVGDTTAALGEIQEFLTGTRDLPELHRVLATVMFVDVVQSTERAAQVGDHRWRETLEQLDRLYDRELQRFGARKIRTTGDGGHVLWPDAGDPLCRCDPPIDWTPQRRPPRWASYRRDRGPRRRHRGHGSPYRPTRMLGGPSRRTDRFSHGRRACDRGRHRVRRSR